MDASVPRWEWRTFGKTIETRIDLSACPRTRHVKSSEIYLATPTSRDNPKIRGEAIDVKRLQSMDDAGLEQWTPVLKAAFPLSVDLVSEVCRSLELDAPPGAGPFDLDALLKIIEEDRRAWATRVFKVRSLYDVDGCIVESSDVTFDGHPLHTVAAEDPDPARVWDTVAKLGLQGRENISYVTAVQRLRAGTLA